MCAGYVEKCAYYKLTHQIGASGQNRNMTVISESGLHSLVLTSKYLVGDIFLVGCLLLTKKHLTFVALNVIMFLGYRKRGENMVAKLGRPTNNPKNAPVHVRLDNKCTAILEQYCRQENISRAEAIRKGIMKLESDIKE